MCCGSEGSVRVDFNLEHTYYLDRSYPSPEALRSILVSELRRGKLGVYPASMENFVFERIMVAEGDAFINVISVDNSVATLADEASVGAGRALSVRPFICRC